MRLSAHTMKAFDALARSDYRKHLYGSFRASFPALSQNRFDQIFQDTWHGFPILELTHESTVEDLFFLSFSVGESVVTSPEFFQEVLAAEEKGYPRDEVIGSLAAKLRRDMDVS